MKKRPYRTTVSLSPETGIRLMTVAKRENASPMHLMQRAIEAYLDSEDPQGGKVKATEIARRLVGSTRIFENPYQDLVAHWRLCRTDRQLGDIAAYQFDLEAWSADIYLMRILSELLSRYDSRDVFLTL